MESLRAEFSGDVVDEAQERVRGTFPPFTIGLVAVLAASLFAIVAGARAEITAVVVVGTALTAAVVILTPLAVGRWRLDRTWAASVGIAAERYRGTLCE